MFQMSGNMPCRCDTLSFMSNERTLIGLLKKLMDYGAGDPPPVRLGLSVTQINIIDELVETDGLSVRELSALLYRTPPTVSVAVKNMENSGFLQKAVDTEDGRIVKIKLTGKAWSLHKKIEDYRREKVSRLLRHLDEKEQGLLLDLLDKALQ